MGSYVRKKALEAEVAETGTGPFPFFQKANPMHV
jgi:hypothetical protein